MVFDELRAEFAGEIDTSARRRAEYSSDASNYRVLPRAVAYPRDANDILAAVAFARRTGIPLTPRGAGTSVAGNAIGPGLVLDCTRHLNAIEIDGDRALVQPGVVLADLQRAAAAHGLRFGPDPSTASRCTLGGMIGNNACGPRAVAWGRTSDNVRALRIVDGTGTVRNLDDPVPGLDEFVRANLAVLRTELGRFTRQASGYSLEHLLPERHTNLTRAFVGTEGTCGIILDAAVALVPIPERVTLVVLGYPDLPAAADDVGNLLSCAPLAIEGLDARLVDVVRRHKGGVPELPNGAGWLFVEVTGDPEILCRNADAVDSRIVTDPAETARLWQIRADGAGLSGRSPRGLPAWPGWEDAAVPVPKLGAYLRDFSGLCDRYDLDGSIYGHFGDGCIHIRLDAPLERDRRRFRDFLVDAAELVAAYGGSLSGEHGDGRARSELLPIMYSEQAIRAFEQFKGLFDPSDVLNPGVLVRPRPLDADLRLAHAKPVPALGFALHSDGGDLNRAAHRCVGVGKCRATGTFMCPSYQATKDEKDVTRGRARVLQEALAGRADWAAVDESLDLCLSCKACASDCPAGVDIATYKSEMLYRRYRGKLRPLGHYTLGWLPRWLRGAKMVPRVANTLSRFTPGVDRRRGAPQLARQSFRAWWRRRARAGTGTPVLLWVDTFTDAFAPDVAIAAVAVLEAAGARVSIADRSVCCGLTWITTGQLDGARRRLRRTLDAVAEYPVIVGLEPSCTAVLRSDLPELLPDDPRAARVAAATRTFAEYLEQLDGWAPPDLHGQQFVVQPHCHQHAVLGFGADRRILQRAGATVTELVGCCGLAGNFGMEHHEVSVAVAEQALLPALRAAPDATLLADGFSCRTQAHQLAGRSGRHLAQLLRDGGAPGPDYADAPAPGPGAGAP